MSFKRILLIKPSGKHGLSFAFDIIPTGLKYIAAYIEDVVDEINIIDLDNVILVYLILKLLEQLV